ncbi:LysR-family transcriptional regulator [plant metagenome]
MLSFRHSIKKLMNTLRFFRTFLAVARHGSYTEAGEHVGLTQAAVSFQMRALENELGRKLFERSGRLAVLTAAGHELVPEAIGLLDHYERLRGGRAADGRLAGAVSLGAIVSCMATLSQVVSALKQQHRDLDVRVFSGKAEDLAHSVEAGELDAALVVEPRHASAALRWTPLYDEPLVVIAPASLPVRRARDAVARSPFLRFDRNELTGRLVEQTLHRLQWPVNEFLELNAIETLVELVRQEVGVTLLPKLNRASWHADPALTLLPLPAQARNAARAIGMIERMGHGRQDVTAALLALCAQRFGGR